LTSYIIVKRSGNDEICPLKTVSFRFYSKVNIDVAFDKVDDRKKFKMSFREGQNIRIFQVIFDRSSIIYKDISAIYIAVIMMKV